MSMGDSLFNPRRAENSRETVAGIMGTQGQTWWASLGFIS